MDQSTVNVEVKIERDEDLGGLVSYRANASNDYGFEANGTSTTSPAIAAAEAIGNLIDSFH